MPRDQLLDELFKAFQERDRWSIKALRERTQQPEAYLNEVLSEVAFLHRSGEFNGNWELMANYKGEGVRVVLGLFRLLPHCGFGADQGRGRPWSEWRQGRRNQNGGRRRR